MLVLTRRLGERVMIGDDVVVTVIEITRTQVRLGFIAPHDVEVLREELLRRPDGERRRDARP